MNMVCNAGRKPSVTLKLKIAAPGIVALVLATLDHGVRPALVFAAEQTPGSPGAVIPAKNDQWRFAVAPYIWGAGLNGDVTLGPVKADVDLNFIDILKDFGFGGMLYAEARTQRYGFFTNMLFVRTKDDSSGTVNTDVKTDTAQVAAGAFYRVLDWQWGESAGGQPLSLALEPLAGVRWSYLRGEIEFSGGPVNLPQADRSESFFDPIVGARVSSDLSEDWLALISADVGGFGVGSDYSWNVQGHVGYRASVFGLPTIFSVGYRALHQKYEDGDFKWDVTQHGPILGVIYTF
jgi:hypothetical protein